ncbi:hypothetical protein J6590_107399, partial [Homalodisca vitripennis]
CCETSRCNFSGSLRVRQATLFSFHAKDNVEKRRNGLQRVLASQHCPHHGFCQDITDSGDERSSVLG